MVRWKCFVIIDKVEGNPRGLYSPLLDDWDFNSEPQLFKLLRGRSRQSPSLDEVLQALRASYPIVSEKEGLLVLAVKWKKRRRSSLAPEGMIDTVLKYLELQDNKRSTVRRRINELIRLNQLWIEEKPKLRGFREDTVK